MKKIILTVFVACTVGFAFAESGTYESIAGGTVSMVFPQFSRHSIMSKLDWSERNEENEIHA